MRCKGPLGYREKKSADSPESNQPGPSGPVPEATAGPSQPQQISQTEPQEETGQNIDKSLGQKKLQQQNQRESSNDVQKPASKTQKLHPGESGVVEENQAGKNAQVRQNTQQGSQSLERSQQRNLEQGKTRNQGSSENRSGPRGQQGVVVKAEKAQECSPQQSQQITQSRTGNIGPIKKMVPPKLEAPILDNSSALCIKKPKAGGTKGVKNIQVETNHFELDLGQLKSAIRYHVTITPDTPKNMLQDVMKIVKERHYRDFAVGFDGRHILCSTTKLPFGNLLNDNDIKIEREGRPREFKVEIEFIKEVDLMPLTNIMMSQPSAQEALQILDIVLRSGPLGCCIPVGRSFFTPPRNGQLIDLGNGMQMYYGFFQSAIRAWKPLLNLDVVHKAFPLDQPVLDLICQLSSDCRDIMTRDSLKQKYLSPDLVEKLKRFIRGLKVEYLIPGQAGSKRAYRVNDLHLPADAAKFQSNGKETTVAEYFQKEKRNPLQYPHLPTLWVGARERENKILLPIEFCRILPHQAVNRKLDEKQTRNMIRQSATNTDVRKKNITSSLHQANYNDNPCMKAFGFSVSDQFKQLDARVLEPPRLAYKGNEEVTPGKGVWRADRYKFYKGATINKWTVLAVSRYDRVQQFAENIYKTAISLGINMTSKATPSIPLAPRLSKESIRQHFQQEKDKRYDVVFVIVPNSNAASEYAWVKQVAELNIGCLTQCIKEATVRKLEDSRNHQIMKNLLLKVNSKMNGTNHILSKTPGVLTRPCMIMGADVTHPKPEERGTGVPSVVAVTASHDPKAFCYNIRWRLQSSGAEIIEDLGNIVKEQLKFFYQKTGYKPESIIFFRDGVSEGQFEQVASTEIRAIRRACKELESDDYQPAITFLVVQKRHHTRLFPVNKEDSDDRNWNVPAGTCVDTDIVPLTIDNCYFYLVSHASIQGVARPTKYCTLHDDNNMSNDDIQELTYHLCHMFTRCNRSVSYPAPTYYAHLAAFRVKLYLDKNLDMARLNEYQEQYKIQECILKDKPMFFV